MGKKIVLLLLLLNGLLMYYLYAPEAGRSVEFDNSEVKLKKNSAQLKTEYRLSMPDDVCFSIGPFEKTFEADRVMGDLVDKGVVNERRTYADTNSLQTNYVVYLPPRRNKVEAIKIERKLKAQGIRESYIISTGVNKDAIFLGIYTKEDKAQKQLLQIKKLGYQAKMEPRQTARNLYWLDIRGIEGVNDLRALIDTSIQGLAAGVITGNC